MAGILPYLRLLRAGTLFSPAADVLASACVVAAATGSAVWSADIARAAGASVLLYGAGMVWNDIADRAVDARVRPERPLPSGQLAVSAAIAFGTLLLAAGLALSPWRLHHGLIAALVLVYDFASKRVLPLGAITMGLLRALNLLTAAAPLWPEPPRTLLVAAACYAGYIVAVTFLGSFEDDRSVRPRAVVAVQAAPPVLAFLGTASVQHGLWPAPALLALPILWFARRNRLQQQWDRGAIRRSMMLLLLGTMLYTAMLCVASGEYLAASLALGGIPLARRVTRAIALRTMS